MPPEEVVDYAIQVCDVLSYLHNRQPTPVVFRDMKPANIMLCDDGHIVLVDFGIAKQFQPVGRGTMIGTEGYAPPEQYKGIADPRVDIYALGATMHHLLTDMDPRLEPPFSFHQRQISTVNPRVSPELVAVVERSLSYEPHLRFRSATLVQKALEGVPEWRGKVAAATAGPRPAEVRREIPAAPRPTPKTAPGRVHNRDRNARPRAPSAGSDPAARGHTALDIPVRGRGSILACRIRWHALRWLL